MPPSWHCSACQQPFPVIADVPWLFAAPAAALQEWRQRFAALIRRSEQTESELRARLRDAALARDAWRRIAHLADAHVKHRSRLLDLLAPLQLSATTAPLAALEALQKAFEGRAVVGVPSQGLLGSGEMGGGSFHCITQQEPA